MFAHGLFSGAKQDPPKAAPVRFLGLPTHCTSESIAIGEISWLAISETVLISAIASWIAFRKDTMFWIALGSSVAPITLLRTEDSNRAAWGFYDHWSHKISDA